MKQYLILILIFSMTCCDSNSERDDIDPNLNKIIGSWQVVSESYSIGGPQIVTEVEDGSVYKFKGDGIFSYTNQKDSSKNYTGSFNLKENDVLTINFEKEGEERYWDFKTTFRSDLLTWYPIAPKVCIEGCSTTFERRK